MQLNLSNIEYAYPAAAEPALNGVTATFPQGWTGIVGDNGEKIAQVLGDLAIDHHAPKRFGAGSGIRSERIARQTVADLDFAVYCITTDDTMVE